MNVNLCKVFPMSLFRFVFIKRHCLFFCFTNSTWRISVTNDLSYFLFYTYFIIFIYQSPLIQTYSYSQTILIISFSYIPSFFFLFLLYFYDNIYFISMVIHVRQEHYFKIIDNNTIYAFKLFLITSL
jgi:hypothetical protein